MKIFLVKIPAAVGLFYKKET